jgi:hypothetical protein
MAKFDSVKKLSLSEIDEMILLLDNSVHGRDNRKNARKSVKVPLLYMFKSATGDFKKDPDQPISPSYFVDMSKGGAGVLTGRRYNEKDQFHAMGVGDTKRFTMWLEVMNVRREGNQYRFGCKILELKITK